MTALTAFATVEGQRAKIARFVGNIAKEAGCNTRMINTDEMHGQMLLDDVAEVILLAFVGERRHRESFEAFFALGPEEAHDYLNKMLVRTVF
ncbi:hypothetical protein [Ruegeria arenilitoris]|uniref:hypothetical protein n=1 Tax=Ruegeria arenilitoris TaxID=1173585 RepID=UPI001480FCC7|nr:hypothetical protein [Ruegeria arenilitoris]